MKVERLQIVSAFEVDATVALTLGPHVQAAAAKLRGRISQISVPEKAPPELPRLLVQMDRALLQIGLNRFQLIVEPPDHIANSYEESIVFARRYLRSSFENLFEAKHTEFEWSGVVAVFNRPSTEAGVIRSSQVAAPLARRLTTIGWQDLKLASFGLKVGRKCGEFFRNYEVAAYELREIVVKAPKSARTVSVELDEAPITEVGITVTLDVNTRPGPHERGPLADLEATLAEHGRAFASLGQDLNLSEFI